MVVLGISCRHLLRKRNADLFRRAALLALVFAVPVTSVNMVVLVSHPTFANSLTVAKASSSHYSLSVISVAALLLLPAVLVYQGWTYRVFRRRVMGRADDAPDTGPLPTGAG